MDRWTAQRAPTFAYEFNDDAAPLPVPLPLDPPVATHLSELAYLFDLPGASSPVQLNPNQEALAARMRAAWANFAASGNPSSAAVRWPEFRDRAHMLSLVPPQPQVETDFGGHHCAFYRAVVTPPCRLPPAQHSTRRARRRREDTTPVFHSPLPHSQ
jgi:para-nitrobenzyl esterase